MYKSVHFLVGSLSAVGTDDPCSVDAEVVADDGFWLSRARMLGC